MFTDCPGCARQFRIRAAQLSAAGGRVKCGYCGRQFNALEHLQDKPLPTQVLSASESGQAKHTKPEPDTPAPNKAAAEGKKRPQDRSMVNRPLQHLQRRQSAMTAAMTLLSKQPPLTTPCWRSYWRRRQTAPVGPAPCSGHVCCCYCH